MASGSEHEFIIIFIKILVSRIKQLIFIKHQIMFY